MNGHLSPFEHRIKTDFGTNTELETHTAYDTLSPACNGVRKGAAKMIDHNMCPKNISGLELNYWSLALGVTFSVTVSVKCESSVIKLYKHYCIQKRS